MHPARTMPYALPAPIPDSLRREIEARLSHPISAEARKQIDAFWGEFKKVEDRTMRVIEEPGIEPDGSCEGGFIIRDLGRCTAQTNIGRWLRDLGLPDSKITDEWLQQHGSKLEGDGILLPDGNLLNWTPYAIPDPRWALAALGYILLLVDSSMRPEVKNTPAQLEIPDDEPLTIAAAGDWGTGEWDDSGHPAPATMVGRAMRALVPDVTVHLGDVYPLGIEEFEREHLARLWPTGKYGAFTFNSNHEMYAAGRGYYSTALGHPVFEGQQGTGYFSIDYGRWIVLGVDTAWFDLSPVFMSGGLCVDDREEQNLFIAETGLRARQEGKSIILLTHYPGLSLDGTAETELSKRITAVLGQPPEVWYWGHNHKGVVYSPEAGLEARTRGRCIGHGALPFGEASKLMNDGELKPEIEHLTRTPLGYAGSNRVRNGFAVLTLTRDTLHERLVDQFGETEWENEVVLQGGGEGPRKKIYRAGAALLLLFAAFALLDWGRLAFEDLRGPEIGMFRALLKLATVFISAGLAWTVGREAFSRLDRKLLAAAFGFIALADTLFLAGQYAGDILHIPSLKLNLVATGVVFFGGAHLTFCTRHLRGLRKAIADGRFAGHVPVIASAAVAMLLGAAVFGHRFIPPGWFGHLLTVYISVLVVSLFAALLTRWIRLFPRCHANLIFAGLLLFVACDATVVMGLSLHAGTPPLYVVTSLTWLFYVPALFFLALSGYRQACRM